MTPLVDVLVPTYNRHASLAVTLAGLAAQGYPHFRVVVSDQSDTPAAGSGEVRAIIRVLEAGGHQVEIRRNLPRRGMAEQRNFLLAQSDAPYALFLDDDVWIEPDMVGRLLSVIERERCGFVGAPLIGLSYAHDVRREEQRVEFWDGPVAPEVVLPGTWEWDRHRLHNAANAYHVQERLGLTPDSPRAYRVAWVGGCVLYDTDKLRSSGGFGFWSELPAEHCGEDVLAQVRVMARYGGCGILPSGAYHLELPTTLQNRAVDAPLALR